jgi:hypothetical protein
MPADFPARAFDSLVAVIDVLDVRHRQDHNGEPDDAWRQFTAAANSVRYRWKAMAEADDAYRSLLAAPAQMIDGRYLEESALFSFFTNALSAAELAFYMMYAAGAQLEPSKFTALVTNPRSVVPRLVVASFAEAYSSEHFATSLATMYDSDIYKTIRDRRHILSHRGSPPRNIAYAAPSLPGASTFVPRPATWDGLVLDATLLPTLRARLATEFATLFVAGSAFVSRQTAQRLK